MVEKDSIFYKSGDIFLPKEIRNILDYTFVGSISPYKSFYINGWSLLHMLSGILVASIFLKDDPRIYIKSFVIHTVWELWQVYIGMANPFTLVGKSSLIDSIVDTIFYMFGVYIVKEYLLNK
jgi:hypothetical protein